MIKMAVTLELTLDDLSKPEVEALKVLMREYTIVAIKINQLRCERKKIPDDLGKKYMDMRNQVKRALIRCFADNLIELDDLVWKTTDFLTIEEEAAILVL